MPNDSLHHPLLVLNNQQGHRPNTQDEYTRVRTRFSETLPLYQDVIADALPGLKAMAKDNPTEAIAGVLKSLACEKEFLNIFDNHQLLPKAIELLMYGTDRIFEAIAVEDGYRCISDRLRFTEIVEQVREELIREAGQRLDPNR